MSSSYFDNLLSK